MQYSRFIKNAPHSTTTHAAKLEFLVMIPNSSAVAAIGAAFAKPTFKREDKRPQVTAINIPFVILFPLEPELFNLSLSIPAFAVRNTPTNDINIPPIT